MNSDISATTKRAGLLHTIASFTDERDLSVLETSMLMTVREIVGPCCCYLFRKQDDGELVLNSLCSDEAPPDAGASERWRVYEDLLACEGTVSIPIPGNSDDLGHLLLRRPQPLLDEERQLIEGVLRIYHNFLSVLEDSQKDKLTGLFNRRTFESRFHALFNDMQEDVATADSDERRRPRSGGDKVWLAMVDIDNFKRINDDFGHLYGDEVLILVARFMRSCFRDHDLLFRFGGEEFAVMLQTPDRESARASFERFRERLAEHAFPQVGRVTASIGITEMSGAEPIPAVMIGRADSALYFAKGNGKNRLVFEDEMPEEKRDPALKVQDDIELF